MLRVVGARGVVRGHGRRTRSYREYGRVRGHAPRAARRVPAAPSIFRQALRAALELSDVLVAELQLCCGDDRVDLVGAAEARDGAVHRGVRSVQATATAPGVAMTVGDRPQPIHQREVLGQLRLLEARAALAPVVLGQLLDPLAGHRAGEQAGSHRRVDDHADPLALGERQHLLLDLPRDQRVGRLQRLDGSDLLDLPQLRDAEVGDADVADEALRLELGERRPALLDLLGGDRPVDLVQIHRVDSRAATGSLPARAAASRAAGSGPSSGPAPRAVRPS